MSDFEISIKDNGNEIRKLIKERGIVALEKCGLTAEGYAKRLCPVAKINGGTLRNSITHVVDESEPCVYIGTDVEYAAYVELGTGIYAEDGGGRQDAWSYQDENGDWHRTHGIKPQPYIRPAITDHLETYKHIIKSTLNS